MYLKIFRFVCNFLGYPTHIENTYILRASSGVGVRMVYSCIGFGIMSFWVAFVSANKGPVMTKSVWIISGILIIFIINVLRVSLLLVSFITDHHLPFNLDHHTIFNLIAYLLIFIMVYVYDKKSRITRSGNDQNLMINY